MRKQLLGGQRKVAVWGTGYIGYSTMVSFAAEGVQCLGTDVSEPIVSSVNDGRLPVPNMEYWLGFDPAYLVKSGMVRATTEWKEVMDPDYSVHTIAIPTEKGDEPWDGALQDVATKLATNLPRSGDPRLVIIESTLTPNKTDQVVIPIFEKNGWDVGKEVFLGVAPRRDWFISPEKNLKNLPRIVGGTTPETSQRMVDVLGIICDHLIPAPDHRHAEIVKSIENAYRHVEITLANQLSLAYPNLNMTKVLRLVGTKWNVGTYHPSFGTGGYCIPLSSKYVLEGAERPEYLSLLKDTIATDSELPEMVAEHIAKRGLRKVGVLGLSYKGDLKVHILSPALGIARRLGQEGINVKINDPYYTPAEIKRITGCESFEFPSDLEQFDCLAIVAGHRAYKAVTEKALQPHLKNCKLIIDNLEETWKTFDWNARGIEYYVAGDSKWLI
ncbi:MAG TPA: nucleotide sugar dehydrogenase [Terriglobales bacterium]|nr:nucleotide sugar dehydrogenase [Terriglobales bacterium]